MRLARTTRLRGLAGEAAGDAAEAAAVVEDIACGDSVERVRRGRTRRVGRTGYPVRVESSLVATEIPYARRIRRPNRMRRAAGIMRRAARSPNVKPADSRICLARRVPSRGDANRLWRPYPTSIRVLRWAGVTRIDCGGDIRHRFASSRCLMRGIRPFSLFTPLSHNPLLRPDRPA